MHDCNPRLLNYSLMADIPQVKERKSSDPACKVRGPSSAPGFIFPVVTTDCTSERKPDSSLTHSDLKRTCWQTTVLRLALFHSSSARLNCPALELQSLVQTFRPFLKPPVRVRKLDQKTCVEREPTFWFELQSLFSDFSSFKQPCTFVKF